MHSSRAASLAGTHKDGHCSGRIHRGPLSDGMLSATKDKCGEHPHLRAPSWRWYEVGAGFGMFEVLALRLLLMLSCITVIKMLLSDSPATMVVGTLD